MILLIDTRSSISVDPLAKIKGSLEVKDDPPAAAAATAADTA